jgi:hypothetical protein
MKLKLIVLTAFVLCIAAMASLLAESPFFELESRAQLLGHFATVQIEIDDASFGEEFVTVETERANELIARPATIVADGGVYWLDISRNAAAEQTLIDHSVLTHGDLRQPWISVKGKLQFRPVGKGRNAEIRPVILVESLDVTLAHHPGDRRGAFGIKPLAK